MLKPYAKRKIKRSARRLARRLAKRGENYIAIKKATNVTYLLR
ncbi:hypothetical protein [Thermoanaerobacterium thermosaccharolyticum]